MSVSVPSLFPLVALSAVANARNEWVALLFAFPGAPDEAMAALQTLFADPVLLESIAPLDCVVPLPDPLALDDALTALLPAKRVIFSVGVGALDEPRALARCQQLQQQGYRLLSEQRTAVAVRPRSLDCFAAAPMAHSLAPLDGPHLARRVDTDARYRECLTAGFNWFSGRYPLQVDPAVAAQDSGARKRLLALLDLLGRDAETRELESLLKQDPALSYHLLKLVNSAAFAQAMPISSFGQAIGLLGRRQLQRWLQLLLYARQDEGGLPNALLPLAALRAAHMEALCRLNGGDRGQQDMAFMIGVFSLLDVLFGLPMAEIVGALSLDDQVTQALLTQAGPLGRLLTLVQAPELTATLLADAEVSPDTYWRGLLQACQWAIQLSRDV